MSTRLKPDEQFARLLEVHSAVAAAEDPGLGGLANIANALRVIGTSPAMPTPDPAFRAELRQRLVAVATVQAADSALTVPRGRRQANATVGYRVQRRIAALAGVVTVATSMAGVGVAAARSLPGQPFYDVKRATESVQLWATRGEEAKGKRHLEFARTRLAEAEKLGPNSSHLASTLAAMNTQTTAGSSELISAYHSTHSTKPLADLVTFSSQQLSDLNQFAATLPPALKKTETQSVGVLTSVVQQVHKVASGVCILCGPVPNGPTPGITSPSPQPNKSKHPNAPGSHHQQSTKPGTHSSTPSSTHPSNHPTRGNKPNPTKSTPGSILPTGIINSILHPTKTPKPIPIVTSLLGLLGGKGK
jgi:hypothetical protein